MYAQASLSRSLDRERSARAESVFARFIGEIARHSRGGFSHFMTALHESREREAARLFRQYRDRVNEPTE